MTMCSKCKKNFAIVFVTKIENGRQKQEGLCIACARELGIQPINQFIEQTGMTDKDIENLDKQVGSLFENMDMDSLSEEMSEGEPTGENPFFSLINKAFPKDENNSNRQNEEDESIDNDPKNSTRTKTQNKRNLKKRRYLSAYGINLNDMAKEHKIDRIIGREKEVDRVIQILNRRTKNNPVLIGEPGVGKTAIAEGLAVRIVNRQVPAKLFNAEIYQLDLTAIVAGTQFRGQFESRMRGIIEEAKAIGNIILVIDELHNIMGAGEAEGAMNAAQIS